MPNLRRHREASVSLEKKYQVSTQEYSCQDIERASYPHSLNFLGTFLRERIKETLEI